MAICPFAKQELIPPGANDPHIIPVGMIGHIAVSGAETLFPYFNGPSGGIESHFYIQWDGDIIQYRDTDYEADANYKANSWLDTKGRRLGMLSVETQGYAEGKWTKAQIESFKRLIAWAHVTHREFSVARAIRAFGGGIGYHSQFPEWSPGPKSCPGPQRIEQMKEVIWPWCGQLNFSPAKAESLKILERALRHARRKKNRRRLNVLQQIKDLWGTIK